MSLLAHVAWGTLFCLPAGFSFAALNLSTFVLSLVAALATYLALRETWTWHHCRGEVASPPSGIGGGETPPLLATLVLVVNPAFVLLSYAFMTDVPFLAWYTLSVWCDLRGLRRGDWRWLALGSAFAALAVLIRQNGIVLPAALGAYLLWQWLRRQRRFPWREGVAALALPAGALLALTALSWAGVLPSRTNALSWINLSLSPAALAVHLFRILLYLGLFALPLTAALALGRLRNPFSDRKRVSDLPASENQIQ
jgi:4-amino-4-deoxy-L-arabinose transferase-like glycosyltransferase